MAIFGAGMLCVVLYYLGGMIAESTVANVSVGVIDYDNSKLSEDFKDYLKNDLKYDFKENYTYDKLADKLIDKDISVIIEIPEGFYEKFALGGKENIIITPLDDYQNTAYVEAYINNYLGSINVLSQGAAGDRETFDHMLTGYKDFKIQVTQSAIEIMDRETIKNRTGFINSVGFFLMFIFSISVAVALMVIDDRQSGVFNRIQVTPVKPLHYIIGSGIFGLFLCLLQIGIFCGYIQFIGIDTGVPMLIIVLFMSLFSLFTVCFSMAIAVVLNSKNAISSIIIGFATVGCILGGAYFPIDLAPKTLQNLARILPQYWFMDALRNVQADVTANIYPNITILALFSILSLLVGAVLFAQNYKNN
jgi:ABC-2 type transport system permease protein